MKAKERLSVPGVGRTVSAEVEVRAVHVRKAVHLLEPELRSAQSEADFTWIFSPRWDGGHALPSPEAASLRAARVLVNIWLLARMSGAIEPSAAFHDAEEWFFGNHRQHLPSLVKHISPIFIRQAIRTLSFLSFDDDLLDLLPYVLELHGPGSRLSVMRDPTTRAAWEAKRKSGIFYTPADVAEYMATGILSAWESKEDLRYLDPSCGTGVYLVALLRTVSHSCQNGESFNRLDFATQCLYGFDISTLAIESTTFILLHHCMADIKLRGISPWSAWHTLRLNLTATDALRVQAVSSGDRYADAARNRQVVRDRLLDPADGEVLPLVDGLSTGKPQIQSFSLFTSQLGFPPFGTLFPEVEEGFEVLIGNPPYADIGRRDDKHLLKREYHSLRPGQANGRNLYPLFIEMMWRLTRPGRNMSAIVVPLSIAFHQGAQYKACRQAMLSQGGRWRCAFFDREPHALFGEDVKTRNAILFRRELSDDPPRGEQAVIETGPLRKWTSRTREELFSSITFTLLRSVNIAGGIPKLSSAEQAHAYSILAARPDTLRTLCECCRICQPREATSANTFPRVFIASTAYNFLNIFRSITLDQGSRYPLSENTIHCLDFHREESAEVVFAILSSRLTFWLWHVQGDGFHVGSSFIQNLPFGRTSLTLEQNERLREAGRALWQAVQRHRIVSLNRGKQTIAYRPLACEQERDAIDDVLLDAAYLPKRFKNTLREFVKNIVIVDENDDRRNHLKSLFDTQENLP